MPKASASRPNLGLWQQPPWASTKPGSGHQMGLAAHGLEQWLPRLATDAEFQRKLGLMQLSGLPEPVFQALPGAEGSARTAADLVMDHLRSQHRLPPARLAACAGLPPLMAAAAQLPDDLCLLRHEPQSQTYQLIAASLCSPSYWRLSEKLGLPLDAIHEPVPGLNAQLGERMQRFFEQMPQGRCFVRRNLLVHADQELYQPLPDAADYAGLPGGDLFLRSERQSLARLNPTLVLFSIRVELAPLADAQFWPAQARRLRLLLEQYSQVQRQAFGSPQKLRAVIAYLAGLRA